MRIPISRAERHFVEDKAMKDEKKKLGEEELEQVSGGVQYDDQSSDNPLEDYIEYSDSGNTESKSPLY